MKNKSCEFGTYNKLTYRICYGLTKEGKMDYSKKLYEFSKLCKCINCSNRLKYERRPSNSITITTDNINNFKEIEEIIQNWSCNSNNLEERKYIRI